MFIILEFCVEQIIVNQIDYNFFLYKALQICKIVISFNNINYLDWIEKFNLNIIKSATWINNQVN